MKSQQLTVRRQLQQPVPLKARRLDMVQLQQMQRQQLGLPMALQQVEQHQEQAQGLAQHSAVPLQAAPQVGRLLQPVAKR